jgi:hypothetical protein
LCGERTIVVQPYFSQKYKRINYNFFHQYQFDLVFDYSTPDKELIAVITSDYKDDFDKTKWLVYTKNNKYTFTGSELVSQENHNLNFLPFVVVYEHKPDIDCDYIDPIYAYVEGNLQINLALSDMLNLLQKQAHGILTLTVPDDVAPPGEPASTPGTEQRGPGDGRAVLRTGFDDVVVLQQNQMGHAADLKYVEQNPNFDPGINVIKTYLSLYASNAGLPSDSLELSIQTSTSTATEVYLKENRTKQALQQQTAVLTEAEKELFDINIRLLDIAGIPTKLPKGTTSKDFHIEFVRQSAIQNMTVADVNLAYQSGVLDKAEFFRFMFPSYTRQEALEQLAMMEEDKKQLAAETTNPEAQDEINEVSPIEEK